MTDPAATLRDPAHQVSTRAPLVWAAGAVVSGLIGVVFLLVSDLTDWFGVPWWAWTLYVVAAAAYAVVMPAYRYRVHRWETTETAVYTQRGWISLERRIAPMSRVQTVDLEQGVIDRIFGLASVTVTTASAAGPVKVEGLDREVAEKLVEDLTRRTEAEPGDAT